MMLAIERVAAGTRSSREMCKLWERQEGEVEQATARVEIAEADERAALMRTPSVVVRCRANDESGPHAARHSAVQNSLVGAFGSVTRSLVGEHDIAGGIANEEPAVVTKRLVGLHRREIIPAEHKFLAAEHELLGGKPGERTANDAEWKIERVAGRTNRVSQQLDFEPHPAKRCARECLLQCARATSDPSR